MTRIRKTLVLVALCVVVLCGIGLAIAGAHSPGMGEKPCPGCPQPCRDNAGAPMSDTMKAHLEEMKGAVAALRASEAKLAGTEDPKTFRAAVVDHLKKLDDLQASHLTHMESMMGRMHGGKAGMDGGRCADCGCAECRCKDGADKGGCRCECGKSGGGHSHRP